ncbi:MAG: putative bifunctional diguanylate cyclase/phosphodiesterase [Wenzhouxiangella sp.]
MSPPDRIASRLINLQYELAMRVGAALPLDTMLRQFFIPTLKSLGAQTALVWIQGNDEPLPTLRFGYPARDWRALIDSPTLKRLEAGDGPERNAGGWPLDDGSHCLRLAMGEAGFAVLIARQGSFDEGTQAALRPIFRRLGAAVLASLQFEQLQAIKTLAEQNQKHLQTLLLGLPGIAVQGYTLDGTVQFWNDASESLYGYTREEVMGRQLTELIIPPELCESVRQDLARAKAGEGIPSGELELMRKDGERIPVFSSHLVVRRDSAPPLLYCIDVDLSERKRHEAELLRAAYHDLLTGLPNRQLLREHIEQLIERHRNDQRPFAVGFLDMDHFHTVNQQLGQAAGDDLLVAIAQRLVRLAPAGTVVARLGGDEFVLLIDALNTIEAVEKTFQALISELAQPFRIGDQQQSLTASAGISLYPGDGQDADTLLRHANQAMVETKNNGRGAYRLFNASLQHRFEQRKARQRALHQALLEGQFELYYQPIIRLDRPGLAGFEALVRWNHPEHGLLSPAAFLSDISGSELEVCFGEQIISNALEQLSRWTEAGHDWRVSINLTGQHLLNPGFVASLAERIGQHPAIGAGQVVLEMLESTVINDLDGLADTLRQCRELGCRIALDDFGTGNSSLLRLRSLPLDILKIDRRFVAGMLDNQADQSIVRSAIELARAFQLEVIAEGPETNVHLDALKALDCPMAQGFAIARPMPAERVLAWAEAQADKIGGTA